MKQITKITIEPRVLKMNFLPQDYKAPKMSDNYMKLQDGDNRIRILSRPIIGWEDWRDKTPVRFKMENKPLSPIDPAKGIKHFWAFIVWNHLEEKIQILEITQATVRYSLEALCKDVDWGSPYEYDIKINKQGEGKDSKYSVNPVPHKPVDPYILKQFKEKPIYLDALFDGADPFANQWQSYTPLAIEEEGA